MRKNELYPDEVRRRLERLGPQPLKRWHHARDLADHALSESAVLIPICERDGEFSMLFTQRSDQLRNHPGEISFPGGRRELADDSLLETALRETEEEIALKARDVHVFGALTRMPTITGFDITAFIGEFEDPYDLIINPDEIHLIFQAPLSALRDPSIHRVEQREFQGQHYPLHYYDFDGHVIWGATGFLLHTVLEFLESAK